MSQINGVVHVHICREWGFFCVHIDAKREGGERGFEVYHSPPIPPTIYKGTNIIFYSPKESSLKNSSNGSHWFSVSLHLVLLVSNAHTH